MSEWQFMPPKNECIDTNISGLRPSLDTSTNIKSEVLPANLTEFKDDF